MVMENIESVISNVVKENEKIVNDWLSGKPGSWGALAGKAVIAVRSHLGRSLSEAEKRAVWQLLWNRLMKIKSGE